MKYFSLILFVVAFFLTEVSQAQFISGVTQPRLPMVDYDSLMVHDYEAGLASTIRAEDIRKHIEEIASDRYEGRELGMPGNDLAGDYIAAQFGKYGLKKIGDENSYFQDVAFTYTRWQSVGLAINNKPYTHMSDFVSFPDMASPDSVAIADDEIVFLGYGIQSKKYNDYRKADKVRGKTILIYRGEPTDAEGISFITGTTQKSEWSQDIEKKLRLAHDMGAKQVLIVDDSLQYRISERRRELLGTKMTLGTPRDVSDLAPSFFISTDILKDLVGKKYKKFIKQRDKINSRGKARSLRIPTRIETQQSIEQRTVYGRNVVGMVEGIDDKLKNEVLVVSAHYDHIGKRGTEINNGADDNASGTTAVIEMAQAFAKSKNDGKGPRRSVLFILLTGEEKGLLGSEYYVDNPLVPLKDCIANMNIDMVGRIAEQYKDNPHYIYVIGSDRLSLDLHHINQQKNEEYVRLTLDHKFNDEKDPNRFYFRSDHYNFAKNGIPAIFFFNGVHADYHRPTDTAEKIHLQALESRARHFFHLAWELTNRDERIRMN